MQCNNALNISAGCQMMWYNLNSPQAWGVYFKNNGVGDGLDLIDADGDGSIKYRSENSGTKDSGVNAPTNNGYNLAFCWNSTHLGILYNGTTKHFSTHSDTFNNDALIFGAGIEANILTDADEHLITDRVITLAEQLEIMQSRGDITEEIPVDPNPAYSSWSVNDTDPLANGNINASIHLTDETAGSFYYFSFQNNSDLNVYDNTSCASTWATEDTVSCNLSMIYLGYIAGGVVHARVFFNDSTNNWNNTDNITITVASPPAVAPTVTLDYPLDNSWYSGVIYSSTPSDINDNLKNASLYTNTTGNWELNVSETNLTSGVQFNFTKSFGNDIIFLWNILVCDNTNLCNWSTTNYTVFIDNIFPSIVYSPPTEVNGTLLNQSFLYENITYTETNLANITISLFNINNTASPIQVNLTTYESSVTEVNFSDLSDGDYNYSVLIRDLAGNTNYTSRFITLDSHAPQIVDINCTSPIPDDTSPPFTTNDTTPTFDVQTNEFASCEIGNNSESMVPCATTGTDGHTCTIPTNNTLLTTGTDYIYINCTDRIGFENNFSYEMETIVFFEEMTVELCDPITFLYFLPNPGGNLTDDYHDADYLNYSNLYGNINDTNLSISYCLDQNSSTACEPYNYFHVNYTIPSYGLTEAWLNITWNATESDLNISCMNHNTSGGPLNILTASTTTNTINSSIIQLNNNCWNNSFVNSSTKNVTQLAFIIERNITGQAMIYDLKVTWAFNDSFISSDVTPFGQNNTVCLFNITNDYTSSYDAQMSVNISVDGLELSCDDDNDVAGSTLLSTTYQTINTSLPPNNSTNVWCWLNYSKAIDSEYNIDFGFRGKI